MLQWTPARERGLRVFRAPTGTERRARRGMRTVGVPVGEVPRVHDNIAEWLRANGLIEYVGEQLFELTDAGRRALDALDF